MPDKAIFVAKVMNWIDRQMSSLGGAVDANLADLLSFVRRHRVGVYGTIIFHLLIAIIILTFKLGSLQTQNNLPVVINFEKEAIPPEILKQEIKKEMEQLRRELAKVNYTKTDLKNAAADVSSEKKDLDKSLTDDRNTKTDELYDEAKRLQERLEAGKSNLEKLEQGNNAIQPSAGQEMSPKSSKAPNPGKVLVNYSLGGRKAFRLPVPAYTCEGGGEVKVIIEVNRIGYVTSARVDNSNSSSDDCLWEGALRSARMSRFLAQEGGSNSQTGFILYRFIPQ